MNNLGSHCRFRRKPWLACRIYIRNLRSHPGISEVTPSSPEFVPLASFHTIISNADDDATIQHARMIQEAKQQRILSDSCAEIVPGLWIGSLAALKEIDNHHARKMEKTKTVWTVISLLASDTLVSLSRSLLSSSSTLLGSRHEVWTLSDTFRGEFMSGRLISILEVIDQAALYPRQGNNVRQDQACLVHCARGVSRSAAVCAAWLMSRRQMSLEHALSMIRSVRPQVSPNLGLVASLISLEKCEGNVLKAIERMKRRVTKTKEA
jgi:Dual specificity phosphatase, catalytic domain